MVEILSILVAILWLPIIVRFYRDYVRRPPTERHPASLAIISALAILVFHALTTFVISDYGWEFTRRVILVAELVAIAQFGVAFYNGQDRPVMRRRSS